MDFPNSPIPEPLNNDNLVPSYSPPPVPDGGDGNLLDLLLASPISSDNTKGGNTLPDFNFSTKKDADFSAKPVFHDIRESERYRQSSMFSTLGYNKGQNNEYKYGERQSWGDVWKNALGGAWQIGKNQYIEGWKGWGRMAEAVADWDSDKLIASSPEELQKMNEDQKAIMNKYAIFSTPESDGTGAGSFFNRSFFGNMVQQSGFAVGAIAQFATEELLTMGLSTQFSVAKLGLSAPKWMGKIVTKSDVLKSMTELGEGVWKSESMMNKLVQGAKKFVPLAGTPDDISRLSKAGAGALQIAAIGVGGLKRFLAESNMAMTEARMEAAGSYGQLFDKLQNEEILRTGQAPMGDTLEKMKELSMGAAHDNFWVNSGILMLSNRMQFDNIFKKFSVGRAIMGEEGGYAASVFKVNGVDKLGGKLTQVYEKGKLGAIGAFGDIAKTYGVKKAAWETAKNVQKGLMKWEVSEGLQEIAQELSNTTMQDYYYDLYHGKKGITIEDSLGKAIEHIKQNDQWMKTFVMGALTGALISPITGAMSFGQSRLGSDKEQRAARKADVKQNIALLNAYYADPYQWMNEHIANVKIQNKVAQNMDEAIANRDAYQFKNNRASGFARTVAAAIKTDMFESMMHTLKGYSENFNDEQFKEAFGVEATKTNQKNVNAFFGDVVESVEEYHKTWQNLKEKYSDLVMPKLYKDGTPERAVANLAKKALDDSIEMLATIDHKSKDAIKRALAIKSRVAAIPGYGASAEFAFHTLSHTPSVESEITLLASEIKGMKDIPAKDRKTKDLLKAKEKQLAALEGWLENLHTLQGEKITEKRKSNKARKGFTDYVNAKNEQSGLGATIRTEDFKDTYNDFMDFMELNKDHKEYIDAYNILSNPTQFIMMNDRIVNAIKNARRKFKEEHAEEMAEKLRAQGVPKEQIDELIADSKKMDEDQLIDIAKSLEIKAETEKTAATITPVSATSDDDLEKHLRTVYVKLKKVAEDQGNTIPEYDVWKKTAGVYETDRYKKAQREAAEAKKASGTQTPSAAAPVAKEDEGKLVINGRVAIVDRMETNGDYLTALYVYEGDKPIDSSQDALDAIQHELIYNIKTKEYKDENGNILTVTAYKPGAPATSGTTGTKTPAAEPVEAPEITIVSGKIYVTVDDKNKYEFTVANGEIISGIYKSIVKDEYGNEIGSENQNINKPVDKFKELAADPKNLISEIGPKKQKAAAASTPEPAGLNIEPQYTRGDYGKVFTMARDMAKGILPKSDEELQLQSNYPKLLEKFLKLEQSKMAELDALFAKYEESGGFTEEYTEEKKAIEQKYEDLARNVIGYVKPEEYDESNDIKDYAQINDRARKAAMEAASEYAGLTYQAGWRQVAPSMSLANTTDFVKETISGNKVFYERGDVNPNYHFNIATPNFMPGQSIQFKVMTTDEEYAYLNKNRLTGQEYKKSDLFNADGTIKEDKHDEVPIAIYAKEGNKDVLIGTVHEPLWISYKIQGEYTHITAPDNVDIEEHVKAEVAKNIALRNKLITSFNNNPNFAIMGHISDKSPGILRLLRQEGKLKDRVNPKIGEGGIKNPHGFFGIVRNGVIQTYNNVAAEKLVDTDTFGKNAHKYSGSIVLMLPTPLGNFMPTFIATPKLDRGKVEFLLEAWKAFTGKSVNPEIVDAVYESVNMVMSDGKPEVGVLRTYIQQYLTRLESQKVSIGDGRDIPVDYARIFINDDGNLTLEAKYPAKDPAGRVATDYFYKVIRTEGDIPDNILDMLQQLKTSVRFPDPKNNALVGINSDKKATFLSMEGGKLIKKSQTYNEYLMDSATTLVEKGVDSKNKNGDWVYFANPVLQMKVTDFLGEDVTPGDKEPVVPDSVLETPPAGVGQDPTAEELFAKLAREGLVDDKSDDEIKEEAKKCGAFGNDA